MNVLDFSTANAQVTNEIINVPDANPVTIKHDTCYNKVGKAILISTAPSGGGTVLVNPLDGASDYTPGDAYTFPEPYNTTLAGDVGYTTIAITNATYHNTDLYVSYYPIWDLLYAARWNNKNIIPHYASSPYDISATTEEVDLTEFNSWPVGTTRRVHAYDGDGSDYLWFTDNGETINGIPIADVKIEGTGGLILTKVDDGEFIAEGWLGGSVFDQDGGNFADSGNFYNQAWKKTLDGVCEYNFKIVHASVAMTVLYSQLGYTITAGVTETFPASGIFAALDVEGVSITPEADAAAQLTYHSLILFSASTTTFAYWPIRATNGTADVKLSAQCKGRWTTTFPEAA